MLSLVATGEACPLPSPAINIVRRLDGETAVVRVGREEVGCGQRRRVWSEELKFLRSIRSNLMVEAKCSSENKSEH